MQSPRLAFYLQGFQVVHRPRILFPRFLLPFLFQDDLILIQFLFKQHACRYFPGEGIQLGRYLGDIHVILGHQKLIKKQVHFRPVIRHIEPDTVNEVHLLQEIPKIFGNHLHHLKILSLQHDFLFFRADTQEALKVVHHVGPAAAAARAGLFKADLRRAHISGQLIHRRFYFRKISSVHFFKVFRERDGDHGFLLFDIAGNVFLFLDILKLFLNLSDRPIGCFQTRSGRHGHVELDLVGLHLPQGAHADRQADKNHDKKRSDGT